ncbi:Polysulfide reductase NrfD [Alkalidesulfovibrio alkalitolerans DSM 16529]|jgi:Ni/Fe-hydrogenase subunit HybB-like protein|uniref:Polysulfide reductase NrfD n=1 Tax=Alkalidesulfovibrio alkalitolerans DSM 16529 TaxID=1121439 RepID=S7UA16_9BACT|nr:Ni/Fe-hydrogenase cytochrome b subunit [Alkalidesulfovibrio alkalitolerans]EPR30744.1 Polysulfide reductase NrfD [Alkalidesulfovibrio alkalitolerans DSM 16529]
MSHPEQTKSGLTPFTVVGGFILLLGLVVTVLRFTGGLGAVTNLDDNNPWGVWIAFDLLCGVALAAGGYTTSAACYIFGLKRYHGAVRPAILTAFLGYALVVFALHYDVGQPWRLPYPIFVSQGTTSLLFEVGLCVFLYLTVLFIEFSPAALEWLGRKKVRDLVVRLTLLLTIFGVVLSTLHQSSLGALFLIAPSKLHPLWYSSYLPLFFFVSSMFAGMSMVIFESTLSHRHFHHKMDKDHLDSSDLVAFGFSKAACVIMCGYLALKLFGLAMDGNWHYLGTGWGSWFLFELLGFVALPALLYAIGARERNLIIIRWAAVLGVLGIVLNRFNVSLVAFNYHLPSSDRYFPHWMEIVISLFIVTVGVFVFRFVVTRMPIFHEHPEYKESHH